MLITLALVAVVPLVLDALQLGLVGTIIAQVVRWGLLVALVVVALAVVYRVAPDRDAPRFRWVSTGALVAAALWILGSVLFSLYVNNFGSYNKTYGALAGVVVLMLWLYLTSYIVLLGAEINAESERQTRKDTTKGEPARWVSAAPRPQTRSPRSRRPRVGRGPGTALFPGPTAAGRAAAPAGWRTVGSAACSSVGGRRQGEGSGVPGCGRTPVEVLVEEQVGSRKVRIEPVQDPSAAHRLGGWGKASDRKS